MHPSMEHCYPSPPSMADLSPVRSRGRSQPGHPNQDQDQPLIINHHAAIVANDIARLAVPAYGPSLALPSGNDLSALLLRPARKPRRPATLPPPAPIYRTHDPPPFNPSTPHAALTPHPSLRPPFLSVRQVAPLSRHATHSGRYHPPHPPLPTLPLPPPAPPHVPLLPARAAAGRCDPLPAAHGSHARYLRDRQLCGHAAHTHMHRSHLRTAMHPRVLIAPTSGDVEAVTLVAGTAFAIASAAKPTVTENRDGNLIVANVGMRRVWSSDTAHRLEVADPRFAQLPPAAAPAALDAPVSEPRFAVYCTVCVTLAFNGYVLSAGGSAYAHETLSGPEIQPFGQIRLTNVRTGVQVELPAGLETLPSRVATGAQSPVWPQLVALGCDDGTVILVNIERLARRRNRGLFAKVEATVGTAAAPPGITALGFGAGAGAHLLVVGTDRTNFGDAVGPAAVLVLDVRAFGKVHGPWLRASLEGGGVLVDRQAVEWPWSVAGVAVDQVDGEFVWFSTSEIEGSDRCVHRIKLHDGTGRPCSEFTIDRSVFTDLTDVDVMTLSRCNRYLVLGGNERMARVFDLHDPSRALALLEHEVTLAEPNVYDTRWLRHSNLLVTVAGDGVVRFWDIAQLATAAPTIAEAQLGSVSASVMRAWTHANWATLRSPSSVPNNPPDQVLAAARRAALERNATARGLTDEHNGVVPWHAVPVRKGLISRVAASDDERVLVVGMEACALALGCDEVSVHGGVSSAEVDVVVEEEWLAGVGFGSGAQEEQAEDRMEGDGEHAAWMEEQAAERVEEIAELELDV